MMAIVSLFPIGAPAPRGLGKDVAAALDVVDKSGLDYKLTAMGTILEGDWDAVMKVVKKMREKLLRRHARVYMTISVDERRGDRRGRLESKVKSVEAALGRPLRK